MSCLITTVYVYRLEEALSLSNPDSKIWSCQSCLHNSTYCVIPADSKHDIIQSFLEFKRCEEEICMLKEEMDCFLRYYNDKISIINSTIVTIESHPSTAFNKGSIALLNRLRWCYKRLIQHSIRLNQLLVWMTGAQNLLILKVPVMKINIIILYDISLMIFGVKLSSDDQII